MNSGSARTLSKLNEILNDNIRQSILWLIVLLIVLLFGGMWTLSNLNLNYSQRVIVDLRNEQISEVYRTGLGRIEYEQKSLEEFTTSVSQLGETFYSLRYETNNLFTDERQLQNELETALRDTLINFDGAAGIGLWYEPNILSGNQRHYNPAFVFDGNEITKINTQDASYEMRDWFTQAIPANWRWERGRIKDIYWTPVYFDARKNRAQITLITPMINARGHFIGFATTDWTADRIIDLVSYIEVTQGSFAFLLDSNNRNLSSLSLSDDTRHAQNLINSILELQLTQHSHYFEAFNREASPLISRINVDQRSYSLLHSNTLSGMVFGIGVPQDEIDAVLIPVKHINQTILFTTAIILILLSAYLIRRIIRLLADLRTAYTDSLTGLANRLRLTQYLNQHPNSGLILINLDRFSEINSLFGNQCGDSVLIAFAKGLNEFQQELPNTLETKLFNVYGDEFALVGQFSNEGAIHDTLSALFLRLKAFNVLWHEQLLSIDFTCGAVLPSSASSALTSNKQTTQAAIALHEARQQSLHYCVYDHSQSKDALYAENQFRARQLREALNDDRIFPYFQPIYDNNQHCISKYECLIRMQNEHNELVSPGVFLDIAHRLRLDRQLTLIMIEKCFRHFSVLPYEFSINLSYSDLVDPSIIAKIMDALHSYNIGHRVIFEILESDGIKNYAEVIHFIQKVKAYGCRIAIDDFGTGYSNFEHLLRLNVDIIKIDASLIKSIHEDQNARILTQGIVTFAKQLNLQTVAEFVHCEAVQHQIAELGVDFSQGAYFGMPSPSTLS
ncbi:EAL domain-containing protein [Nitrincola nitratireducens]|uniref:Cyclic di-GMP phosphodiesterase YfgF n=1 Tax=Nitrincola nitratireducens TaxID=1229521 RepID=W9V819_9GAMM|nr:EAL domain-containing protein [Nitrincola nitratireducens]EXJ12232.1 Cyclic di-GMP phosphodiesterase YfgF [Nitrincola nitratireducens]